MTHTTNRERDRARRGTLAVVLWAFGFASTVLLLGLWGRTVTTDQATIEDTARAALSSEVVSERITGWVGDALDSTLADAEQVNAIVTRVTAAPQFDKVLDELVRTVVEAAMADPATEPQFDLAAAVEPIVPVVVNELGAQGIDVPRDEINAAVAAGAAAILDGEQTTTITDVAQQTRSFLTTVLVVGLAAIILLGALAIALAKEPLPMFRSLATRLAVSALTFVIVLRVGAWAIDPSRGRSPLPQGGEVLLASNHLVLLLVTGAGLAVALSTGVVIRNRRAAMRRHLSESDYDEADTLELIGV